MTPAEKAKILKEAKARFSRVKAWQSITRANQDLDEKFAEGDAYNNYQWPLDVRNGRGGRPCLTSNVVRQHNLLVINDARENKAQVKVSPVGGDATYEAAQIFSAMIRSIEYTSKAVDAYSTGIYHQVTRGLGYIRVGTEYEDDETFNQRLCIIRVPNPKTIYLDPDAKEYDKSDMKWAFVFEDIARDVYEAEYGEDSAPFAALDDDSEAWVGKDHIRAAEYWVRGEENDNLFGLSDGSTVRASEVSRETVLAAGLEIVQEREISTPKVRWYKLRGNDVVEEQEWLGKYIPIVPVIGEETLIDGTVDYKGHTRAQIDDQRMYNYWNSAAVEQVALQGKSPWTAPARAIEGYEEYWKTANTVNHSVLPWNDIDDDGNPVQKPDRIAPPVMAQAYVEGMNMARERVREVTGQYQAEQGAPSNERSGVAIQARQRQSAIATYQYVDNQAKAVRQVGRILLDAIPKYYDAARVVKILAEDGVTQSDVHINPNAEQAHQQVAMTSQGPQPIDPSQAAAAESDEGSKIDVRVIFNPNIGTYAAEADVGPSFGTQREEGFNAFQQVFQAQPDLIHIAGDLMFDNGDFPGALEFSKRLKRMVPPAALGGPPPALLQAQQQAAQLKQEAEHRITMLQMQLTEAQQAVKDKDRELALKDYEAETRRLAANGTIDPESMKLLIREQVSQMLGMPALPLMAQHAAAENAMLPPEPEAQGTVQ